MSSNAGPTTSAEEQKEVAAMKAKMAAQESALSAAAAAASADELATQQQAAYIAAGGNGDTAPAAASKLDEFDPVEIDDGVQKYVLIQATDPESEVSRYFVRGDVAAEYHKDAARATVDRMMDAGLKVNVTGGGRIRLSLAEKSVRIYGFSYGFGLADHSISQQVCEGKYPGFDISWSNEGY